MCTFPYPITSNLGNLPCLVIEMHFFLTVIHKRPQTSKSLALSLLSFLTNLLRNKKGKHPQSIPCCVLTYLCRRNQNGLDAFMGSSRSNTQPSA
jgi:hypothetical protein